MKKSLTFIFLWLSIILAAQPQTGTVRVNVEDGCGRVFSAPVTIDLYQLNNNTPVKIATSNTHPAEFTNLDRAASYEVRLSSSEVNQREPSIKDIYASREVILGIQQMTLPSVFAADVNGNGGVSTLDQVMMMRHILQVQPLVLDKWFFVDQQNINILRAEYYNKTSFQGIPNGERRITFNGYHHGAVESTIVAYCGPCINDAESTTKLVFPDIDVQAGKEVEFSLGWKTQPKDGGMSLSLKYNDGSIKGVTSAFPTNFNLIDSTSTLNLIVLFSMTSNVSEYEVVKIKFVPNKSGKLISFFKINDQFNNEVMYKDANCLKTYGKIQLELKKGCEITWPRDITIQACFANINSGSPLVIGDCVDDIKFSYVDQVFGIPCEKILRTWTAVNFKTSEIYTHTQIITIDPTQFITCFNNVNVLVKDSAIIYAVDFVQNPVSSHIYSFSEIDRTQTSLKLYNKPPYKIDVSVYDLTINTFCTISVNILSNGCNDPINIKTEVFVTQTAGTYIINGDLFNAGNENHCKGIISDFQIKALNSQNYSSQLTYDYNLFNGKMISLNLRYKVNGVWTNYNGEVKVNFEPDSNLPPFEFTCFDDPVTKNELFEIAFFSPSFENIYALQAAIRLKDAILVGSKKKALSTIAFNEELRALRFVWYNPQATPLTLSDKDTLFTLTIRPTISGNLSDIISIAEDIMRSEAILNNLDGTKIDLVFKFLRRPTATQNLNEDSMIVFPNPSNTGQFFVETPHFDALDIMVYDQNGQAIWPSQTINNSGKIAITMPENAPNGLYVLKAQNDKVHSVRKIVLLR